MESLSISGSSDGGLLNRDDNYLIPPEEAGTTDEMLRLRQWYEDYRVSIVGHYDDKSPAVLAAESDIFDIEYVEHQITKASSDLPEFGIFCVECQYALDHWPRLPVRGETVHIRFFDSISLEAVARKGCRFCEFLLRLLEDEGTLNTYRCIENRLQLLGKCRQSTMRMDYVGMITLALPGKRGKVYSVKDNDVAFEGYESYGGIFDAIQTEGLHGTFACQLRFGLICARLIRIRIHQC